MELQRVGHDWVTFTFTFCLHVVVIRTSQPIQNTTLGAPPDVAPTSPSGASADRQGDLLISRGPIARLLVVVFSCYVVSSSFATPRIAAHRAPLCMGLPRQEYWSGFPFPSPGALPDPGIEPASPTLPGGLLPLSHHRVEEGETWPWLTGATSELEVIPLVLTFQTPFLLSL